MNPSIDYGSTHEILTAAASALGLIACLAVAVAAPAHAREPDQSEPTLTFDFDYPPETTYELGEKWSFGAILDIDTIVEQNLNLDSNEGDDRATLDLLLDSALAY